MLTAAAARDLVKNWQSRRRTECLSEILQIIKEEAEKGAYKLEYDYTKASDPWRVPIPECIFIINRYSEYGVIDDLSLLGYKVEYVNEKYIKIIWGDPE